jgi:CheY-like chemotaxis protein
MMPGVSGIELHRWLAQSYPALAARTVFTSGGAIQDEYLKSVGNPLLAKPFDSRSLLGTVDALVRATLARAP